MLKLLKIGTPFSTVAILAGGARNNSLTKRIINYLKEDDPDLKFIGIAGNNCDTHFKTVYAYSQEFPQHSFEALNHYKQSLQEWQYSPYMFPVHQGNKAVLNKIEKGNIYEDLIKEKVAAVINVGNWSFSRIFLQKLKDTYAQKGILKPPIFLYDRSIFNRRIQHEQILDYQFYQLPRQPDNFGNYRFPSMCIGYEAVFKIYSYLAKYKKQQSLDYRQKTRFSEEYAIFLHRTQMLIQAARNEFRNKISVGQDVFVISIAPGKSQDQIDFTMKRLSETINQFFESKEMKDYPVQKFELWVIPPRDTKGLNLNIPSQILPSLNIRYIPTTDRINALCSSDVAIAHNGQVTVEAAVCHLPTIIIDNRSMPQAYLSYLFNRYESPLNITTQKMGYQQLLSKDSAIPDKLSTLLIDHFINPKLKFFYIDTYEKALKDMLKKSERNPNLNVSETGLETSCQMVIGQIKSYEQRDHKNISTDWRQKRLSISG